MTNIQFPISATCLGVTISINNITKNKRYNCSECGFGYYGKTVCEERANFNVAPTPHSHLYVTEIEILISNNTNNNLNLPIGAFKLIDSNGYMHEVQCICHSFLTRRHRSYLPDIHKQTKFKCTLTFPELEDDAEVSKVIYDHKYDEYCFELNFCPFKSETSESFYDRTHKPHSQNYYKTIQKIDLLKSHIFQRLNNFLTKSEKIRLENLIMNNEFEIKLVLKSLEEYEKIETEKELCDIMSDYHKRLIPANGNKTEVWERISNEGTREDLGETVFRSSWEANIARILNSKGIHWEYETTPFILDNTSYLPDFFLDDGTIMEIKGHWDNESITKVEAFMRSNPETNYLIVDHDMYPDLTQMYADKTPNWEKVQAEKEKVNVVIVGLAFVPDKSVVKGLQVGDVLQMELEPNNQYDKFAIAVKTANGGMVGHIEKKFAPIYAQKLKLGMTFSLDIISVEPKIIRAKAYRTNWEKPIVHSIFNSEA